MCKKLEILRGSAVEKLPSLAYIIVSLDFHALSNLIFLHNDN